MTSPARGASRASSLDATMIGDDDNGSGGSSVDSDDVDDDQATRAASRRSSSDMSDVEAVLPSSTMSRSSSSATKRSGSNAVKKSTKSAAANRNAAEDQAGQTSSRSSSMQSHDYHTSFSVDMQHIVASSAQSAASSTHPVASSSEDDKENSSNPLASLSEEKQRELFTAQLVRIPPPAVVVVGSDDDEPHVVVQEPQGDNSTPAELIKLESVMNPVGRDQIDTENSQISRRHSTIEYTTDGLFLKDNSTNGTSLNGVCLMRNVAYRVDSGDTIQIPLKSKRKKPSAFYTISGVPPLQSLQDARAALEPSVPPARKRKAPPASTDDCGDSILQLPPGTGTKKKRKLADDDDTSPPRPSPFSRAAANNGEDDGGDSADDSDIQILEGPRSDAQTRSSASQKHLTKKRALVTKQRREPRKEAKGTAAAASVGTATIIKKPPPPKAQRKPAKRRRKSAMTFSTKKKAKKTISVKEQREALIWALKASDTTKVKRILKSNPEFVSTKDDEGWPALHCAMPFTDGSDCDTRADVNCMAALLDAGADPLATDDQEGMTVIQWCAAKDQRKCLKLLIDRCPVDHLNSTGKYSESSTPLHFAVLHNNTHVMKMLLEAKCTVDVVDSLNRSSPLVEASRSVNLKAMQLLLEYDADPNLRNHGTDPKKSKHSSLHMVAQKGSPEGMELLLRYGASPSGRSKHTMRSRDNQSSVIQESGTRYVKVVSRLDSKAFDIRRAVKCIRLLLDALDEEQYDDFGVRYKDGGGVVLVGARYGRHSMPLDHGDVDQHRLRAHVGAGGDYVCVWCPPRDNSHFAFRDLTEDELVIRRMLDTNPRDFQVQGVVGRREAAAPRKSIARGASSSSSTGDSGSGSGSGTLSNPVLVGGASADEGEVEGDNARFDTNSSASAANEDAASNSNEGSVPSSMDIDSEGTPSNFVDVDVDERSKRGYVVAGKSSERKCSSERGELDVAQSNSPSTTIEKQAVHPKEVVPSPGATVNGDSPEREGVAMSTEIVIKGCIDSERSGVCGGATVEAQSSTSPASSSSVEVDPVAMRTDSAVPLDAHLSSQLPTSQSYVTESTPKSSSEQRAEVSSQGTQSDSPNCENTHSEAGWHTSSVVVACDPSAPDVSHRQQTISSIEVGDRKGTSPKSSAEGKCNDADAAISPNTFAALVSAAAGEKDSGKSPPSHRATVISHGHGPSTSKSSGIKKPLQNGVSLDESIAGLNSEKAASFTDDELSCSLVSGSSNEGVAHIDGKKKNGLLKNGSAIPSEKDHGAELSNEHDANGEPKKEESGARDHKDAKLVAEESQNDGKSTLKVEKDNKSLVVGGPSKVDSKSDIHTHAVSTSATSIETGVAKDAGRTPVASTDAEDPAMQIDSVNESASKEVGATASTLSASSPGASRCEKSDAPDEHERRNEKEGVSLTSDSSNTETESMTSKSPQDSAVGKEKLVAAASRDESEVHSTTPPVCETPKTSASDNSSRAAETNRASSANTSSSNASTVSTSSSDLPIPAPPKKRFLKRRKLSPRSSAILGSTAAGSSTAGDSSQTSCQSAPSYDNDKMPRSIPTQLPVPSPRDVLPHPDVFSIPESQWTAPRARSRSVSPTRGGASIGSEKHSKSPPSKSVVAEPASGVPVSAVAEPPTSQTVVSLESEPSSTPDPPRASVTLSSRPSRSPQKLRRGPTPSPSIISPASSPSARRTISYAAVVAAGSSPKVPQAANPRVGPEPEEEASASGTDAAQSKASNATNTSTPNGPAPMDVESSRSSSSSSTSSSISKAPSATSAVGTLNGHVVPMEDEAEVSEASSTSNAIPVKEPASMGVESSTTNSNSSIATNAANGSNSSHRVEVSNTSNTSASNGAVPIEDGAVPMDDGAVPMEDGAEKVEDEEEERRVEPQPNQKTECKNDDVIDMTTLADHEEEVDGAQQRPTSAGTKAPSAAASRKRDLVVKSAPKAAGGSNGISSSKSSAADKKSLRYEYLLSWAPQFSERFNMWVPKHVCDVHFNARALTDAFDAELRKKEEELQKQERDRLRAAEAKKGYRAVNIESLRTPNEITRAQILSDVARERKAHKEREHRRVRSGGNGSGGNGGGKKSASNFRRLPTSGGHDSSGLPMPKQWDLKAVEEKSALFRGKEAEDVKQQIIEFLEGRAHLRVEIGEILDPDNPAKIATFGQVHEHAYGIFARANIKKGTVLMEYVGEIRTKAAISRDNPENCTTFKLDGTKVNGAPILLIDSQRKTNECVYLNDYRSFTDLEHRKQNVNFEEVLVNGWPHVFAMASRNIPAGGELLVDYGPEFWKVFHRNTFDQAAEASELRIHNISLREQLTSLDAQILEERAEKRVLREELQALKAKVARLESQAR